MTRLVDTSAWIELLSGSALVPLIRAELPAPGDWLVPTIVQFELSKWSRREMSEDRAREAIAFSTTCAVIELDTAIALLAAELGARYRLSIADAVIYATASAFEAELLTCDRHFEGLPGVRYIPKSGV